MAGIATPRRGDIYWVNLDPTLGTEIRKHRPAVVVSNNAANSRYGQVTVVPLTSKNLDQVEPFQVMLTADRSGMAKDSKALAEQIRTVSKLRLSRRAGRLTEDAQTDLDLAIKVHLGLEA